MSHFREFDRATGFLLPPSVDEWLPERHLARFVVEVIEGLDLSAMVKSYRGTGSAGYHPALLLGLLVYGYATGVFSSRKLERDLSFRLLPQNLKRLVAERYPVFHSRLHAIRGNGPDAGFHVDLRPARADATAASRRRTGG
jgi:transposase